MFSSTLIIIRKDVYLYDYIIGFSRFKEYHYLEEIFYCSLANKAKNDTDYNCVQNVCNTFNLNTLGNYRRNDLCVTTYGRLSNIQKNLLKNVLLSVFTSPALAWQASLKMVEQAFEYLTHAYNHLFVDIDIRSGVSMICCRFIASSIECNDNF